MLHVRTASLVHPRHPHPVRLQDDDGGRGDHHDEHIHNPHHEYPNGLPRDKWPENIVQARHPIYIDTDNNTT